jgi:hypothetical protein
MEGVSMNTQKIRCGKCGEVVAELDGDRLTFDHFRPSRRGRDADEMIPRTLALGIDEEDTKSLAADGLEAVCRGGNCVDQSQTYPLAQLVNTAKKLRRTGQASTKVSPRANN